MPPNGCRCSTGPSSRLRDTEPETQLPAMPLGEHVIHDYRSLGLSLKAHPVAFLRERLDRAGVTPNADLASVRGRQAGFGRGTGAGAAAAGQGQCDLPDAGGREGASPTSSSGRGCSSASGRSSWERASSGSRGKLQSESGVIHIVAEKIEDLTPWLSALLEEVGAATPSVTDQTGNHLREESSKRSGRPDIRNAPITQDIATLSGEAERVMPKGRNFQ